MLAMMTGITCTIADTPARRLRLPLCCNDERRPQIERVFCNPTFDSAAVISTSVSCGYTVLTHEAIVDSVWDTSMRQLLLKRFPDATPEELEEAHAYAYGGCIIQDLGYYPFGSHFFSDLTHYVRSGDFITALIRDSQDLNEYAFALGALEHYASDTEGHRIATNRAVPMLYPELRRKFGIDVTYWDNPVAHIRTEFGFDVLQVASARYASERYQSFIGFQVSRDVLERAFLETYGIEMKDIFGNVSLALGSYRYSIGSIVPGMTRVAWSMKKAQLKKEIPGITRKKFLYNLSRSSRPGTERLTGRHYSRTSTICISPARSSWKLADRTGKRSSTERAGVASTFGSYPIVFVFPGETSDSLPGTRDYNCTSF